ncbi:MAG: FAD-binding oxidoreductase [Proteobacteria bacterium]|nr:FAD-binding oxidoreductase [Pseudomonadota bacterium]
MHANVLILGGGIIGTSLAAALATRGVKDVVVVDLDLAGVYASSELNAGGARATWWHPVNIETCSATLRFFAEHSERFGFRKSGYLWLYDDAGLYAKAMSVQELQNRHGLGVESLAPTDAASRFPLLDRNLSELVGATFSPSDGLVNPNAVRAYYREQAECGGVRFCNRHYVAGVRTERVTGRGGSQRRVAEVDVVAVAKGDVADSAGQIRSVLTQHRVPRDEGTEDVTLSCDSVVNCLGAWSALFSAKVGVPDMTEPVRRQISLVDVHSKDWPEAQERSGLGMVVDASGLYFHPEGPHILAGYSTPNEAPGFDFEYDGDEFFQEQVWPRLAHRASAFEACGHVRGWAGLYAVTPDCSGIAGAVPGFSNLYEAHSFTGRGVMQSFAVGRALAALVTTGRYDEFDLGPLTRTRFGAPERWVQEELHI